MKTKLFSKILGVGLAIGLVFALGAAIIPAGEAQADEMEWSKTTTPSWDNLVIEPGSDISDYVAAGENGDTVYALGAIYGAHYQDIENDGGGSTPCGGNDNAIGLSGDFEITASDSYFTITAISDDVADITGDFEGDTCYLKGDFTWIMEVWIDFDSSGTLTTNDFNGEMAVSGEIVETDGSDYDTMKFTGKLYRDTGATWGTNRPLTDPAIDGLVLDFDGTVVCVDENRVESISILDFANGSDFYLLNERNDDLFTEPRAWMSDDGGVTWTDITATVQDATNLPGPFIQFFYGGVDAAPNDEDWLAIGGGIYLPPCDYERRR